MKNLLIISLTFLILFSCSSDSDNNSNSSIQINPPEWLQGTWMDESQITGFKFTTDDICIISFSSQACNKEQLELFNNTDTYTNVSEEITNDYYSIEITIVSSVTSYQFEKISDTEIKWLNIGPNAILVKQ